VPHWVRDAGHFKECFTGGEKRLKGQDVRVTGSIAYISFLASFLLLNHSFLFGWLS